MRYRRTRKMRIRLDDQIDVMMAKRTSNRDRPEDQAMQRAIILRANRSMLILNMTMRRRTGRPIGMHLDLRDKEFVEKLSHMRWPAPHRQDLENFRGLF